MPALPTSNLTLHLDTSTNARVWTSSAEAGHPSDGGDVGRLDSLVNNAHDFDLLGTSPQYRDPGLMLLPSVDFNGSTTACRKAPTRGPRI